MANLNMTKEDVFKQVEEARARLLDYANESFDRIKRDVEITTQVHAGAIPHALTGLISTVNDLVIDKHWNEIKLRAITVEIANGFRLQSEFPEIVLAPGRYRVFCHVHKMPE